MFQNNLISKTMSNNTSLDTLNSALMDVINALKNPEAKQSDIDRAKTIADLGKVMVEGYKVKAQVLNTIVTEFPDSAREMIRHSGIADVPALPAPR